MTDRTDPSTFRPATLPAMLLAAGLLAGCASPGTPKAPSLKLPEQVTDLSAIRIGDRVKISFTTPTRTTDGADIAFPMTVEICRDPLLPTAKKTPCTPILRTPAHPGLSTYTDALPPALLASTPPTALAYRVRVFNPANRAADPADPALVPTGPSEPPVDSFRATQVRTGVLLDWSPTPPASVVEVTRTLLSAAPPAPTPKPSKILPMSRKQDPAAPVHLRPATAAHGMFDKAPATAQTYTYTAERISALTLAGETLTLHSEPTPVITLTRVDTFPPAAPRGLVSIPGLHDRKPTIDLSWDPNTEPDILGYRVFRVDMEVSARPASLTPNPIPTPAFRDADVIAGHRYRYTVTAVDRAGNQSLASPSIEDTAIAP